MACEILEIKNICKTYNRSETAVLEDVSLKVSASKTIALVGPSGSGKTSLLQIIGLLDSPSSGEIYINGTPCFLGTNEEQRTLIRRDNLGFIYQFHNLLPEFSALENLSIPQMVRGISRLEADEKSKQLLNAVGLAAKYNSMPGQLSGGEQQRVAIARSLVNDPKIVLADEPTGNLDKENSDIVIDLLINSARKKGLVLIIVTHNLELAKKADIILTIENGKLKYL